jgi:hypothetical protein
MVTDKTRNESLNGRNDRNDRNGRNEMKGISEMSLGMVKQF